MQHRSYSIRFTSQHLPNVLKSSFTISFLKEFLKYVKFDKILRKTPGAKSLFKTVASITLLKERIFYRYVSVDIPNILRASVCRTAVTLHKYERLRH